MRILYITDQIHTHGGIEKILAAKISYLAENTDNDVFLITGEQKGLSFLYPIAEHVVCSDLGTNYTRTKSYFSKDNLKIMFHHFIALRRKICEIKPDIIVSSGMTPDHFLLPIITRKIPTIKEIHFSGAAIDKSMMTRLFKLFLRFYSIVAVLNKDELVYYKHLNTVVIPNFVENDLLPSKYRENIIIAAGRISEVKRFTDLIEIWNNLGDIRKVWKLKIFGNGDNKERFKLLKKIEEYDLSEEIDIIAATQNLNEELLKSKIYVMTSKTECFPMVLLEAQTAGLPSVSYDCPFGPRNIIKQNKTGILVENGNVEAFAVALEYLMRNEEYRMSLAAAAKKNSIYYTPEIIMQTWQTLFSKLARNV